MKRFFIPLVLIFVTLFALSNLTFACDAFRLIAKDGTVMIARSMEFVGDLKTELRTSPRGRVFTSTAPDSKPGMTWKAKYGYVYMSIMGQDINSDGMNEQGLSVEVLLFPGYAKYQTVPAGGDGNALPYFMFSDWVLSNFKTVDEVRQALPNIYVFSQLYPGMGDLVFPVHFSIYEASGKGLIVEYYNGELHTYDNPIGVLTNSPNYNWHMTNLNNYTQLRPTNPKPVVVQGMTFVATGQGAGMVGLPGDISPPSRFTKTAVLLAVVTQPNDAKGALNLAEHIINNFDIPYGLSREPMTGNITDETTQWVVFKDLTNKVFYYRTYNDMSLHAVTMSKLDFTDTAPKLRMPIASPEYVKDMTDEFLQKKTA